MSPSSRTTYTYDGAGNRTAVAEANGDGVTYSYDETYQLTREQRSGANAYDMTYTYDGVGNRLTKLEGGVTTTYTYDNANELTVEQAGAALTTYTYDANGNTQVINAAGSLTTHSWDIENHMTIVQLPAGGRTTATYDGDGKRRSYEDSVMLRNFLWARASKRRAASSQSSNGENIFRQTGSDGGTNRRYTYNPQVYGELISQDGPAFHHYDALGSTRNLTDGSQSVTDTRDYKAFGSTNASSGSSPNRFWWIGRLGCYAQPDTGDHWVRARIYRPTTGRWVSRDRLRLERNRYVYASTSPVRLTDANGLQECGRVCIPWGWWRTEKETEVTRTRWQLAELHGGESFAVGVFSRSITKRITTYRWRPLLCFVICIDRCGLMTSYTYETAETEQPVTKVSTQEEMVDCIGVCRLYMGGSGQRPVCDCNVTVDFTDPDLCYAKYSFEPKGLKPVCTHVFHPPFKQLRSLKAECNWR